MQYKEVLPPPHIILKVPGTLRNLKAMGQCLHFGKSVQDKRVYHCPVKVPGTLRNQFIK